MKKMISLVLVIMLLCTSIAVCYAETPDMRSSNYFHSYGTNMRDAGNGVLSITFSCVGMGVCSQLGVATYEVEKLNDNGGWENVSGLLNGQTGSNVAAYAFGRYFYGVSGETYRVNVTFCCTLNGGSEYKAYTSASITLD